MPITKEIGRLLADCKGMNPAGHIFSLSDGRAPIDHKAVDKHLYRALARIGILEDERRERGLTFHSLRHFANAYFNYHFEQHMTMTVIGHATTQMNRHYDHVTEERLNRFREVMEKLGAKWPQRHCARP